MWNGWFLAGNQATTRMTRRAPKRSGTPCVSMCRAEVLATFRDAMAKLRRETGGKLDDDEALLLMARHILGGPKDAGRSSYQVAVTVCPDCSRARQHAGGE